MSAKLMWNSLSFSWNTFKPSVLITSLLCEVQKGQVPGPVLGSQPQECYKLEEEWLENCVVEKVLGVLVKSG